MLVFVTFIFGMVFGSFFSLISYRLPRSLNLVGGRSKCPKCGHVLGVRDLIPVFSWVLNQGKCRYCSKEIKIRYPLIEISTGFIAAFIVSIFGLSNLGIFLLVIASILILIIIIDYENYIIPDSLQVALLMVAAAWSFYYGYSLKYFFANLIGGFLTAYLIGKIFEFFYKQEGLGFGDVKFIGISTVFIGFHNLTIFYLISGTVGAINGLAWQIIFKKKAYPFAPSLCFSLFFCLIIPSFFDKFPPTQANLLNILFSNF